MSKIENIRKSIEDAKRKIAAIEANSAALEVKKVNIDKQLKANQDKRQKLLFFLEKTTKTLESKNSTTA